MLIIFGKIHFLLISENEFFHEINVTELRDGITSLHGIHVKHPKRCLEVFFVLRVYLKTPGETLQHHDMTYSAVCLDNKRTIEKKMRIM